MLLAQLYYSRALLGHGNCGTHSTAEVLKTVSQIDALICNAAIAQVPKQTLTVDGWESQMGTNHFGNWTLQALNAAWNNWLVLGAVLAGLIGWAWVTRKSMQKTTKQSKHHLNIM